MTPCPASCADLAAPSECEQVVCVEGCNCAPGFVLSDQDCVPYSECGCTYLDRYYLVSLLMHVKYYRLRVMMSNELHKSWWSCFSAPFHTQLKETFVTEDCSQSCECTTTGAVCQTKGCGDTETCTVYNTKRDCYKCELSNSLYYHKMFSKYIW